MAFPNRGGSGLSAPRLLTLLVSVVLVGLALASMRMQLPQPLHLVVAHRFWVVVAGYAVLLAGVLLRRL